MQVSGGLEYRDMPILYSVISPTISMKKLIGVVHEIHNLQQVQRRRCRLPSYMKARACRIVVRYATVQVTSRDISLVHGYSQMCS